MWQTLFSDEIFRYTIPLDDWIDAAVDYLQGHRDVFMAIRQPVAWLLEGIQDFLLWMPPLVLLIAVFVIAWRVASWRLGVFSVSALAFVGFLGLWSEMMTTLAMVMSSVLFCVLIGLPLGIWASRSDRFSSVLRPVLDIAQTTPTFVYLIPVVMLFSIGTVPGVIATIIFAMPPMIRLTELGIRQVQADAIEAAEAFGSSPGQILWKVQVPLAMPTIMAGLNQTILLSLSMVVIAAFIGAGGLGKPVFEGLNALRVGFAGIGGVGIVLLAMVLDRITQALGEPKRRKSRA
jgi:glycine betaine/proline transport system permease protein